MRPIAAIIGSLVIGCGYVENPTLAQSTDTSDTLVDGGSFDDSSSSSGDEESTTTDGGCSALGCECMDSSTCADSLDCINGICQLAGTETTEVSDTSEFGDCEPDNEYCISNGCMGMTLRIDADLNGVSDLGWCYYACMDMDSSMCPTLDGAQIECVQWNMDGDEACFPLCQFANDTCPLGMICYDADLGLGMGVGVCSSDVEG